MLLGSKYDFNLILQIQGQRPSLENCNCSATINGFLIQKQ